MIELLGIIILALMIILICITSKNVEKFKLTGCRCATKPLGNQCDNNMLINCEWGFQWIYYLQNIYYDNNGICITIPLEIIGYVLPISCQALQNTCYAIGMIQYSYGIDDPSNKITRKSDRKIGLISYKPESPFSITLKDEFKSSWSIKRDNINPKSLKIILPIGEYTIQDGRGLYPQGARNDGFVKSGPNLCDTAYSCSYLRTIIKQKNNKIGIGYGEFVKGTFPPKKSQNLCCTHRKANIIKSLLINKNTDTNKNILNWHCFYLHFNEGLYKNIDVQACRTTWKGKTDDPYARMQIAYPNKNNKKVRKWVEGKNAVKWQNLQSWTSPTTNIKYEIGFRLFIPEIGWIKSIPIFKNAEVTNGLTKYSWFGTTKLLKNNKQIGIGITEIFHFS
jgi:hypothetical protein